MSVRVYPVCMFIERGVEYFPNGDSSSLDAKTAHDSALLAASQMASVNEFEQSGSPQDDVAYWAGLNRDAAEAQAAAQGAVRGPFVDASGVAETGLESLAGGDLLDRVVELAAERSRAEARYLAAVGELVSRDGVQSAAWQLREYTRMNSAQARSEARLAGALGEHELGDTLDALAAGEIQLSHAKVIAREAPKIHRRSEDSFLGLCRAYPSDVVARHTLAYESQQVYADLAAEAEAAADGGPVEPADAELALQRHQRRCSLRLGDDGMWHLHADLDFLAGRQISTMLAAAERAVRQLDDSAQDSFPQRNADALCDLMLGRQRPQANLVIAADYDIASGRLANARLDDGTPLSAAQLAELAADAKILPAVFNSDWSQLALGRVRSASEAQRIILAVRDGGCIACAAHTEHCHAHHIDYYEDGGNTDIANLANLCEPCHLDHHRHQWPIETPPDGRPRRAPLDGQSRRAPPASRPHRAPLNGETRQPPPDGQTRRAPPTQPGADLPSRQTTAPTEPARTTRDEPATAA